jgi:hypothetical protein
MEEHEKLELEIDHKLLNQVFDNPLRRHILIYLFLIRKEFLKNLEDDSRVEFFIKISNLESPQVAFIRSYKDEQLIDVCLELGLFANVKDRKDFDRKEDDYEIKYLKGIRVDENVILVDPDALFRILKKTGRSYNKAQINKTLKELSGISCQNTPQIHNFVKQADEEYYLPDDLYYLLESYCNPYQSLRIELTIDGFAERVSDWDKKLKKFLKETDPLLLKNEYQNLAKDAIKEKQDADFIKFFLDKEKELPKKFKPDNPPELFLKWKNLVNLLLRSNILIEDISKNVDNLVALFSGKISGHSYFDFMKATTFNEAGIVDNIQKQLVDARKSLLDIQQQFGKYTERLMRLINLDYERALLLQEMEENDEEVTY